METKKIIRTINGSAILVAICNIVS